MTRTFVLFAVAGSLFLTLALSSLSAAVIERDWKTPGDGLLTYDTVNKREWLDVPVSMLTQFHPTNADLATDIALAELMPGGLFEGFTFATHEDVLELVSSVTPLTVHSAGIYRGKAIPMRDLVNLLGPTSASVDGVATNAVVNEITDPPSRYKYLQSNMLVGGLDISLPNGSGTLALGSNDDLHASFLLGMMLYRDAIPEPSGGLLIILAAGFALHLRWREGLLSGRE